MPRVTKRLFAGNPPGDRWQQLGIVREDEHRFRVFARKAPTGWTDIKLVATDPTPLKANYWLGWDGKRWARCKDQTAIMARCPSLIPDLETLLEDPT